MLDGIVELSLISNLHMFVRCITLGLEFGGDKFIVAKGMHSFLSVLLLSI